MARTPHIGVVSTAILVGCLSLGLASFAVGQSSKTKSKPPKPMTAAETRQVDSRLEKLQDTFSSESAAIIESYEKAGQYEKAKFLLEVLHKLDPKSETLKKRITDMEEKILDRTEVDQKFIATNEWTLIGTVEKDKPARVESIGEYKLSMSSTSLTADGFPTEDVTRDLVKTIPTGALMGMIVTEAHQKDKKVPEPFAVKAKHDFTPKEDGELYLKVNVPPSAKCSGDLKLKLSGVNRGMQ